MVLFIGQKEKMCFLSQHDHKILTKYIDTVASPVELFSNIDTKNDMIFYADIARLCQGHTYVLDRIIFNLYLKLCYSFTKHTVYIWFC